MENILENLAIELRDLIRADKYKEFGKLQRASKQLFQEGFEQGFLFMKKAENEEEVDTFYITNKNTFGLSLIDLNYQELTKKNNIMENPKELIGRKVRGFKFESNKNMSYIDSMNSYIGKVGVIENYFSDDYSFFGVKFKDGNSFCYPADQIEAHLVEDEIPTLSDGVMMLVSDNNERWHKRKVIGKKENRFLAWYDDQLVQWTYCKPLEPTKEEQLIAILGSSEKVSEIMELFNDKK